MKPLAGETVPDTVDRRAERPDSADEGPKDMKICVYTTLLGGYDALLQQEVATRSEADFLCFTDDPELTSATWQTELVEPYLPQDLHRSSRVYKILGHERLREYDVTICIDASVRLLRTPEEIVAEWLTDDVDMALAVHSFRDLVLDEFDEVVRLNYDDRARVYEQLTDYAVTFPDVLEARPHWGGLIVRRTSPSVDVAMRLWFDHVLRYSRRDQLSLMVALLHGGASFRSVIVDNFRSDFHEWPIIESRRVALGKGAPFPSGPLVADLRRARKRVKELEDEIERLDPGVTHSLELRVSQLKAEIEQGTAERVTLEARVNAAQRHVWELETALSQRSSVRGAAGQLRRALKERVRGANRPASP
tara:strand:- start:1112 stop:2200 length:1089 start_codon:yes stop_codon:yes gene_type:complete